MKILKINLGEDHDIVLSGDYHEGSVLVNKEAIDQSIRDTEKKNTYMLGMGDYCEAITVDDERYQRETQEKTILEQYKDVKKKLYPIKNKVIVFLEGNHDWRLSRRIGGTVENLLCEPLGVEFGGYTSIVWVYDGKHLLYKIHATHGFGLIQSRIDDPDERRHSMERALKRKLFLKFSDALIQCMGHSHHLMVKPPSSSLELRTEEHIQSLLEDKIAAKSLEIVTERKKKVRIKSFYSSEISDSKTGYIRPSSRWYVNTGGFLKLYDEEQNVTGYAEVRGYDPLEIGYAKVICRGGKVINIERVVLG